MRPYKEQDDIPGFAKLPYERRRREVETLRKKELYRLEKSNRKLRNLTRRNYAKTAAYLHLTRNERETLLVDFAKVISGWGFARLFAECIDKAYFDPSVRPYDNPGEQAFEQVVSRFESILNRISKPSKEEWQYGILIHDNNQTVEERLTLLMRRFLAKGTLWTKINHIIETPLFVSSQLTYLVQMADLCAYAIRRYQENGEEQLFDLIFNRADRVRRFLGETVVGVRHFSDNSCKCKICIAHKP